MKTTKKTDKAFDLPEEVKDLIFEHQDLRELRDVYAKQKFGYRKARRAAVGATRRKRAFWKKVFELYPEYSGVMSFRFSDEKLIISTKESLED